jgi:hypothetical protein
MITINDLAVIKNGRKDRKTKMEITKPYVVVQYNKFINCVDRADQYLIFYSVLRKTVKWLTNFLLYLLNCVLFNTFFVCTKHWIQKILKNFLYEVGRFYVSEVRNRSESSSDDLQLPDKQKHQGGLNRTREADSLVTSEYTNLKKKKKCWWGGKKGSIVQDSVKCVLHINEVKLDTFVNSALIRLTKGLVLRSTIQ